MIPGVSSLLQTHDVGLALLAGSISVLGSFVTLVVAAQARVARGDTRRGWVILSAFAAGALFWTTHFVGMLSYDPGTAIAFAPRPTSMSFFVAVVIATAGFAAGIGRSGMRGFAGGAIVGLAMIAMYAMAMEGFHVRGLMVRNAAIFTIGAVLLVATAASALALAARAERPAQFAAAPLILAAGIFAFHALAHLSLVVEPVRGIAIPDYAIPPYFLGYFVAAMCLLLFGTGIATIMIVRGFWSEASLQLRNITDAAVEGLVLTDGEQVLDVNASFRTMLGGLARDLVGRSIWSVVEFGGDREAPVFEAQLRTPSGPIPIEVIARDAETGGAVTRIFAVRDLRERRAAERRIRYLAHFDTLTGLPNRASFQDRFESDLAAIKANGDELAVLILDLDHFKEINDVHGHAAGDELLKAVTGRINTLISPTEFAARLGGDEFVVLQSGAEQPASAGRLAEELVAAIAAPFEINGQKLRIGLTVGVAIAPRDGTQSRTLLANADLALYRAKARGRSRACFFTPEMDEAVRERRILALDLKRAIEENDLTIHYQAQAAVAGGEIIGFEALARWSHPTRGDIPPAEFVAIAEESDLILELGEWVLRAACREAASWTRPYRVAVNVSAIQLKKANLPEIIHTVLLETGMPAERLELEITETALIDDMRRTLDILRRIKALGVSIAMDDFGTGYSSLSMLQAFPFDKIKIDRSFVETIGSRRQSSVIVTAVLGIGRSLHIPVLAEGVETDEQLSFLNREHCTQVQGFLIGRPAAIEDIRDIVFAPEGETPKGEPRAERPEAAKPAGPIASVA